MRREYKVSDFLKRIKNQIMINDADKYKRVTVSGNHRGVSLRDEVFGSVIGTKKQFTIQGGDFILSKIDARNGAFGIIPEILDKAIITGNFWTYSVNNDLVDTEWFFYFTHSYNFIQICLESSTGSTHRKYLDEKVFLNHKIILPEIEEQKEMVQKYKARSKKANDLTLEINYQKSILSNLKQSILQEAITGKLTEDWRRNTLNTTSAIELFELIKAKKSQLEKNKEIKREKELPPIVDEEIPFELPEGWVWCKLRDICSKTGSGSTPKGGRASYPSEGIKFLRSQNVYNEGLRYDGLVFISEATHTKMKGTKVQPHDLLLNITGGSIGRCCIVPKNFDTGNINQHVAIIRPILSECAYFLHIIVRSPYFQNMIIKLQTGAGREGLPKNKMDSILIPLPPLKEQKEIIERIEHLTQNYKSLEEEIVTSETNAQILIQAVLKESFENN